MERIPTIKDLIKRLNDDIAFKLDCGFLVSDAVPSEASYSRLVTRVIESGVLETENENVVRQAKVHQMGQQSVIAYNKRNEGEPIGFDEHFAPTCFREHSYRYNSFDPKYETLKYTRPKECIDCPLANEGICQKVYKVKITQDLRKYTAPARGSLAWKNIFKRRTSVERGNAYLKEYFQIDNVRYRTGARAKVHFDMVTLVYNASKLAADRINAQLIQQQAA